MCEPMNGIRKRNTLICIYNMEMKKAPYLKRSRQILRKNIKILHLLSNLKNMPVDMTIRNGMKLLLEQLVNCFKPPEKALFTTAYILTMLKLLLNRNMVLACLAYCAAAVPCGRNLQTITHASSHCFFTER